MSSTSRAQASVSHSSAELCAMTQASVESLGLKHFIQEFDSKLFSRDVKIIVKTDSSAGKPMAFMSKHLKKVKTH